MSSQGSCGTCGHPGQWQCIRCPESGSDRSVTWEDPLDVTREIREMADRPDPLAEPEGYGASQQDDPPDLSVCSGVTRPGADHCDRPVEYVTWVGCTHEHVGPVADCEQHARQLHSTVASLICGICRAPIQILRTEPELPSHPGMIEMLGKVFDVKVSDGFPGGGGEYAPERFINPAEDH